MNRKKSISFYLILILFSSSIILNPELDINNAMASIITVDDDGGANFTSIQAAIDNASNGDTIHIWSGIYQENLIINKTISLIGNGTENTIIMSNLTKSMIHITSNWVNVSNLTITNSGSGILNANLELDGVNNCTVSNVNSSGNYIGLLLNNAINNNILDNRCNNTYFHGISLRDSHRNNIRNNTCINNSGNGIYIYNSSFNQFSFNSLKSNLRSGLYLEMAGNNKIDNNSCLVNSNHGIFIDQGFNNEIENNTCNNNDIIGIYHNNAQKNWLINNSCNSNLRYGIYILDSENLTINDNTAKDNKFDGIYIISSIDNLVIKNYIENNSRHGINIETSYNITVQSNIFINDGLFIWGNYLNHWDSHNIDLSNIVNTKTLYYYVNHSKEDIPTDAGQVILVNCSNINITHQNLSNTSVGVLFVYSKMINISRCKCSDNYYGLYGYEAPISSITNNNWSSNKNYGVRLSYSENSKINNNNGTNNSNGLNLYYSDDCEITNNNFKSNQNDGIYTYRSYSTKIERNDCSYNLDDGINIDRSLSNIVRKNHLRFNLGDGIYIYNSALDEINENDCLENDGNGIYISNTDVANIENNICNMNIGDGIYLRRCDLCTIFDNFANANELNGIHLYASENNRIDLNICNNNLDCGISITNRAIENEITNNTCQRNNKSGIYTVNSDNTIIKFNNCSLNNKSGIKTEGVLASGFTTSGDYHVLENNSCYRNNITGIYLLHTQENNVTNNIITKNLLNGIFIQGAHLTVPVVGKGNTIFENLINLSENGIFLHSCNSNFIGNNTIKLNFDSGIYSYNSTLDKFSDNNIHKNYYGLRFNDSYTNKVFQNQISNNFIGIYQNFTKANTIKLNNITNNTHGIYIYQNSTSNTIFKNLISNNTGIGISISLNCDQNRIFHNNFVDNSIQAEYLDSDINYWNNNLEEGNYWSDYNGLDNGSNGRVEGDGIGDTDLPHLNVDNFPIMNISGWEYPGLLFLLDPGELNFDGEFHLSWNEPRNYIGYILQESTNSTFETNTTFYILNSTLFSVTNKTNGTYYYRVRAFNEDHPGDWSNVVNITVILPPPPPKNIVVADYPVGNTLNLTWDPADGIVLEYHLYYKITDIGTWLKKPIIIPHPITHYNHTNLINGETYYYRIKTIDIYNHSSIFSNTVGRKPWDSTAPATPNGLMVNGTSHNNITLIWKQNTEHDLVGYNIYRSDVPNTTYWNPPINGELLVTKNQFTDEGLDDETTYYYMITALDEVPNESRISNVVFGTTIQGPHGPEIGVAQVDFRMKEDKPDNSTINLYNWFLDRNNDKLQFNVSGQRHIEVTISQEDGQVTLTPEKDWYGSEILVFSAKDRNLTVYDDVKVTVTSVNDPPENVRIINPGEGYTVNDSTQLFFEGLCNDIDFQFGEEEITYSWSSNISGFIKEDNSFNEILEAGKHQITLTVTDSAYNKVKAIVNITIEVTPTIEPQENITIEDKEPEKDEGGIDLMITSIGLLVLFLVFLIIIFILSKAKKTKETHSCPECGVLVSQSVKVCPDCGSEIIKEGAIAEEEAGSDELLEDEMKDSKRTGDIDIVGEGEIDGTSEMDQELDDHTELEKELKIVEDDFVNEVDKTFDKLENMDEPKTDGVDE